MRSSQRGQALVETAIFMPFFLLSFFALIWAAQTSSLSERVQIGVRQGGLVAQQVQPYNAYSLYAMYATLDGAPPILNTSCAKGDATNLSSVRTTFFRPKSIDSNDCAGSYSVLTAGFDNAVILQNDYISLSASAPAPNFLLANGIAGLNSSTRATQNFFRSPSLEVLACVTGVGAVIKANLEGGFDTSAASMVLPSAYPHTPPIGTIPTQSCATFSAQPTPLAVDTPVALSSPYTAPAGLVTPSPYIAPTAGPTPVGGAPTATPTPAYTPAPGSTPGNVS